MLKAAAKNEQKGEQKIVRLANPVDHISIFNIPMEAWVPSYLRLM
jgi:hypothetical protein